jgi:hypothetical protein
MLTLVLWIIGVLVTFVAATAALAWLGEQLLRYLIHDWRNSRSGGSAFNPLLELAQPQIRHVVEVGEHRMKQDNEGEPPVPALQAAEEKMPEENAAG